MKKKLQGLTARILVVMLLTMFVIPTMVTHAISKNDIINNLNTMMSKYPNGSTWCGTYYANDGSEGPWECFGFACEIFRGIFGCEMPRAYTADMWHFANTDNVVCVGSIASPTENAVKNLLSTAKPGDIIQARGTYQHTIVVTNASDVGINIFDANYDGNNTVRTNAYLSHGAIASQYYVGLSLYRYNNYPSDITTPDVPTGALSFAWGDRVQIQWNIVSNADYYECGLISVETRDIAIKTTTNDWYHNFYKVPEGDYYAYVCAINSAGASRHSDWMYTTVVWYDVVYNSNGGSNAPLAQTKYCDTDLTLSSTMPTRTGYTFKSWNTDINGNGSAYAPGAVYTWNNSVTLYAQWESALPYTDSVVTKSGAAYVVETELYNFISPCDILIAGYKNNQLVTMKIIQYSEENISLTLENDVDKIKIMVWDDLPTLKPICSMEEITQEKFIENK